MRTSVRRTLCATAIAGGFTVLGIAFAASSATAADTPGSTSGANGLGSGNQSAGSTDAPAGTSGNQVTVIGDGNKSAADSDQNGGGASSADSNGDTTDGQDGAGAGNQTDADTTAPAQASGNQVTVIGDGNDNTGSTTPEQAGTETSPPDPGETQGDTEGGSGTVAGPSGASSVISALGDGRNARDDTSGSSDVQAGPAAAVAGVLPATGSSAGLLLWAILALGLLLLGLMLVAGQLGGRNARHPLGGVTTAI